MKLREYIDKLEALSTVHGQDLEVETTAAYGTRIPAYPPKLAYRLILKGRETKPAFYCGYEGEDRKGEAVIKV